MFKFADLTAAAPLRPVALGPRGHEFERRADGSLLVRSTRSLGAYPQRFTERLEHWAQHAGDRVMVAERDGPHRWRTVSYTEALDAVRHIGQALLDRGLSAERPVLILSGSGIDHALLALAAMHVGIPFAPLSTGYSLLSTDYMRVIHAVRLLTPGLVFAARGLPFAKAIEAAVPEGTELVVSTEPVPGRPYTSFGSLRDTVATSAVDAATAQVRGDTIAKILFTSGSSAMPKGVINTHRMLCANQQMHAEVWPFLQQHPPVLMDWAPWNHTLGANAVFGKAIYNGGSLYIDDGRPTPEEVGRMVQNLTDVPPTVYFGVPVVYQHLLPHLESNSEFRQCFFSRLEMLFCAGATLPPAIWERLRQLQVDTCGERIYMTSALGCTETAPTLATTTWDADRPGVIGLPVPGVEMKLVPVEGDRYEARIRGVTVTPGYWRQPELTSNAFDEDGWYCMGDAVQFVDPNTPEQGLQFAGRLSENFKLSTGNWVNVGPLRAQANAQLAPLVLDVVVCGESRTEIGMLVFPDVKRCRLLAALPPETPSDAVLCHPDVLAEFQRRLDVLADAGTSSSYRIARLVIVTDPPSGFEMTDKRTLSHNAVLQRRAAELADLYGDSPSARVLTWRPISPLPAPNDP